MYITEKQRRELSFLKSIGEIEDDSLEHLMDLMKTYNMGNNEQSFGKTSYDENSFIRYIIAKAKINFVFEKSDYEYKPITKEDVKNYYSKHQEMFYRENQSPFSLCEVKHVIRKRLREMEYEEAVDGILY